MLPHSWPEKVAFLWLAVVLLTAALAPVLPLPYLPNVPDLSQVSQPPFNAGNHWLGTDFQGLDVLTQLVFGTRTAVLLTLPAAVCTALIGAIVGSAAGFWRNSARLAVPYWLLLAAGAWWALGLAYPSLVLAGAAATGACLQAVALRQQRSLPAWRLPLDSIIMSSATVLDTIPRLIVVVAMAASTNVAISSLLLLLVLTSWPQPARLVRAQMLRVRTLPFVEAAQAAGFSSVRVWLCHALPHALQPLRTAFPLSLAGLLGLESTLSFLGIGLPPNVASWGRLLAGIRHDQTSWWAALFPSLCLITTILSLNILSKYHSPRN